jgi:uncharacterized membrane protein
MKTYRNLLTWFILISQAIYVHHVWHSLPAMLPSHFGLDGTPNRFAPKSIAWVIVGICALLLIFLSVVEKFPRSFNLPSPAGAPDRPREEAIARNLIGWLRLEIATIFAFMLWSMVNIAEHKTNGLGIWFGLISVGIVISTVAYYLARMKKPTNSL